jgi:hypothetical protein
MKLVTHDSFFAKLSHMNVVKAIASGFTLGLINGGPCLYYL